MIITKQGKPTIQFKGYTFLFTSMDDTWKEGNYNYVMISKEGSKSIVIKLHLKGMPIRIMPVKERNKVSKVFNKYIDNGYLTKDKIASIEKDLSLVESVVSRINKLFKLLK